MAPHIYAYRQIVGGQYVDGSPPSPPPYDPFATSVKVGYTGNGRPAGYIDRFYALDVTPTISNYAEGILAAEHSTTEEAVITLSGLTPARDYFVACVRFDTSGNAVSISNVEFIKTLWDKVEVVPPQISEVANWSTEKFNDWFRSDTHPYENSTIYLSYYRQNDAEMGDYVRVKYDNPLYADGSPDPIVFTLSVLDGVKGLSPLHDWHVEIPVRLAAKAGGQLYQCEAGVNMGDQAAARASFHTSHVPVSGLPDDSLSSGTDADLYPDVRTWITCYGNNSDGSMDPWAATGWRVADNTTPTAPGGQKNTFTLDYSAAARELTLRVNGQLLVVLGSTHAPPYYRKKYPHGQYVLPARLALEWQYMEPTSLRSDAWYDIGAVSVQSDCPMHYAGWSATTLVQGGMKGYRDDFAKIDFYDPSAHSLNNFHYVHGTNDPYSRSRYGSTMHAGYTVTPQTPYTGNSGYTVSDYAVAWEEMEPLWPWNGYTAVIWSTELHRGRTLPVQVPVGTRLAYLTLHGYQQHGTIVARVIDQNGIAITDDIPVTSVVDVQPISIPPNTATSFQIEVDIQYDGSAIDPTTMGDSQVAPSQELWRPATPPMFVGFNAWMADPNSIPPIEVDPAPTLTLALGTPTGLTVPVTLTANEPDCTFILSESDTDPLESDERWGVAPTSYTFGFEGSKALYAWAKDAAGNVSAGVGDTVVISLSTGLFVLPSLSVQPAVSTPSLSGVSVSIGSFDCPSVTVTPVVAAPSLSGVTSGTAIRAPSATPYVIRNLSGQPVTFRTL